MNGVSKPSDEFATTAEYMTAETQLIAQVHDAIKPSISARSTLPSTGIRRIPRSWSRVAARISERTQLPIQRSSCRVVGLRSTTSSR